MSVSLLCFQQKKGFWALAVQNSLVCSYLTVPSALPAALTGHPAYTGKSALSKRFPSYFLSKPSNISDPNQFTSVHLEVSWNYLSHTRLTIIRAQRVGLVKLHRIRQEIWAHEALLSLSLVTQSAADIRKSSNATPIAS